MLASCRVGGGSEQEQVGGRAETGRWESRSRTEVGEYWDQYLPVTRVMICLFVVEVVGLVVTAAGVQCVVCGVWCVVCV
jgi:hypothetical protein